jgi:glycosyltransferase involved in cell wall biosynthesis
MATYNGEKTIERQLRSILKQLTVQDELVVVDDCSSDNTLDILNEVIQEYNIPTSIQINKKNQGPIKSFETALSLSTENYIFLADQDDEWFDNKVKIIMNTFKNENCDLVVHDGVVVDGHDVVLDNSWNHYNHINVYQGFWGNIYFNAFTGAMMACNRILLSAALPFPKKIEMHDQWLFLVAKKNNMKINVIEEPLMYYVRHGDNVTGIKKRTLFEILNGRKMMLLAYLNQKRI